MKNLHLLLLFSLLFAACSDDKNEQPTFVTNIVITDADKVFKPGEAITITAQGFRDDDQIFLDSRYPISDASSIKEGQVLNANPVITRRTTTGITLLAPGHLPASTTTIILRRNGDMTLGKVSVADGQAPVELQLYGITNSRSMNTHPRGIQHINLATGTLTDILTLAEGEDFSLVANNPGNYTLCGVLKQNGQYSTSCFDLSMHYWKTTASTRPLTFCSGVSNIWAVQQLDKKNLTIYNVNTSPLSRTYAPAPSAPLFPIPDGFKPETLSRYKGVMTGSSLLFAADHGNGTFSPVNFDGSDRKYAIRVFDPIQANALIPFWIATPKEAPNPENRSTITSAFALAKPNGGGTELCLWNETTNSLEAPFATFPNRVRSIAPYFTEDMKTQELYVLFDTNRGDGIIQIYDMIKKEWRSFPNFNFPYAEILFAR